MMHSRFLNFNFLLNIPGQLNSRLAPSPVPATTYIPPTDKDLEILFQPIFDEYFDQSTDSEPVPTATIVNALIVSTNMSVSTTIAQDAPSTSHSLSSSQVHPPVFPQGVAAGPDTSITQADLHPSVNPIAGEPSSAQLLNQVTQPPDHIIRWTKDHPLDNIVGNPSSLSLSQSPEGFEDHRIILLTRLSSEKALYGLKQDTKYVTSSRYTNGGAIENWTRISRGFSLTKLDLRGMVLAPNVPYSPQASITNLVFTVCKCAR
ncbi:hypothetical protein Tco_0635450 [Tanacetum coccineum]